MLSTQTIGSVTVIKVRASLSGDCLNQCRQCIDECLLKRRSLLVLDLSECPLLNSEGLEWIVDAQQRCLSRGGKLVIADPQPLCAEILYITGLDARVAVFEDMRSALSDFAR
jgi:anti-anti-sigma factor